MSSTMAYNALDQHEDRCDENRSPTPSPVQPLAAQFAPPSLFLDRDTRHHEISVTTGLGAMVNSLTFGTTKSHYDLVAEDDFEAPVLPALSTNHHEQQSASPGSPNSSTGPFVPINIARPRATRLRANVKATSQSQFQSHSQISRSPPSEQFPVRTASGRSIALRHPTPDLQVLQGAYVGNIQQLERSAEALSMTSSIEDAIRDLHSEQKRNDSRRSSLSSPEMPGMKRQISNASSIVEMNNMARSGGYSPAGFMMSPKGSLSTNGRGRSSSKTSRFGARPEPEHEGRPLDSFVGVPVIPPIPHRLAIEEQDEHANTLTRSDEHNRERSIPNKEKREDRSTSPTASFTASINTFEAQQAFADFDGVHSENMLTPGIESQNELHDAPQRRTVSGDLGMGGSETNMRLRLPSHEARPQSYMDPLNGQQMVYYPAPVPMMLNLPPKLSKLPSSIARNKRRSQVLSQIPQQTPAIWLPDVLETGDRPLADDDGAQNMEYVAQHQRATMGGRRLTQDVQHLPPQLRANVYFELPTATDVVALKERSAVATLDSILEASAYAPVSAFTDHAFAGRLGAEVYGKPITRHLRNLKSTSQLLQPDEMAKKQRTSTFSNLLRGRRASNGDLLGGEDERRRNTIADVRAGKLLRDEDEDEEDEWADTAALETSDNEDDDEEREEEEEMYYGAPTTLLAELQLRKQQQKQRVRPVASAYPNGMHSTLLEMDAVAKIEAEKRRLKRINLAWEDPALEEPDIENNDEDVPLAMLYQRKNQVQEPNRPMGLMERRDMEDNEPLSRRRDRLQGRGPGMRASTMMDLRGSSPLGDENETLAQRAQRLRREANDDGLPLPKARPVSGDFAAEMMYQLGEPVSNGKGKEISVSPGPEEEETLGQRKKRLEAEKAAREKEVAERPVLNKRHSMADILQAHPSAGAGRVSSYSKPATGLLGLHEKISARRSSTMLNLEVSRVSPKPAAPWNQQHPPSYNMHNSGALFPQPSLGYAGLGNVSGSYATNGMPMSGMPMNGMSMNGMGMPMGYGMPMNYALPMQMQNPMGLGLMGSQPLNQGQVDMVERWRQSVMH